MKNVLGIALLLTASATTIFAQPKTDIWREFAKTKFEAKYHEKIGEYIFYPTFTPTLLSLVGKEVSLEGYFVPFAPENGNYIILSKFPMSQCFFCGGGGPESIAEIVLKDTSLKFEVDDFISIKGKLKLNSDNAEHVNFIITEAALVKK